MPMLGAFGAERIHIPLASYTAATLGTDIRSGRARGALIVVHVKTAGASTLLFRLSTREPAGGNFYQPNQTYTITVAGTYVFAIGAGVALQPPGESADTTHARVSQVVGIPLPDQWRCSMGKGDASAWEYGVSVRLY